jgi:hypothetical protein
MLTEILRQNRDFVLERWFDRIMDRYHPETKKHFMAKGNPFANPMGSTIREAIAGIFDGLLDGLEAQNQPIAGHLDKVVRIRAIQEMSAAQAVSYLYHLKTIVRDLAKGKDGYGQVGEELLAFESQIDDLALFSFDIYSQCREKLFNIRVYEVKSQVQKILDVMERKSAEQEVESGPKDNNAGSVT